MSEGAGEIVTEAVEVVENITEAVKNGTGKVPATPEGMAIAYGSLVIMALLPIFFGSFRSIKHHADQKVSIFFIFQLLCTENLSMRYIYDSVTFFLSVPGLTQISVLQELVYYFPGKTNKLNITKLNLT